MGRKSFYIALLATVFVLILTTALLVIFTQKSNQDQPNPTSSYNNQTLITKSTSPEKPSATSNNVMLFAVIFVLSVATATSVMTSFYLYSWRKRFLRKPNVLAPEEWGKYLADVGKSVSQLNENQTIALQSVMREAQDNSKKIQNMIETYMSLQKTLDEKDIEIKRLKKGYDTAIIKKFLYRFIRIDQTIHEFIEYKEFGEEQTEQLRALFEDALDECGVEIFQPGTGEDIRKTDGIADNPKKITTISVEDDYKIAEVISPGYRVMAGGQFDYVVPAKVKIFTYQKEEVN